MSSTVVNTPGYYYAISYWLSAFVMVIVEGRGKKDWWKYLYSVLSFISIFLVMFFTDGIKQIFFIPLMLCVFGLMLLYIKMAGNCPGGRPGSSVQRRLSAQNLRLLFAGRLFIFIQAISLLLKVEI